MQWYRVEPPVTSLFSKGLHYYVNRKRVYSCPTRGNTTNSDRNMKRFAVPLLLIPFLIGACSENSVAPTVNLGKTSLSEFLTNPGYQSWYTPGYEAYPLAEDQTEFQTAVANLSAAIAGEEPNFRVAMVIKPNCGCQHTQREMPRIMKTLDQAGFPQANVDVWITDTRLAGISEIKDAYGIAEAPTFLILKNDVEIGRVVITEATLGADVSTQIATAFTP